MLDDINIEATVKHYLIFLKDRLYEFLCNSFEIYSFNEAIYVEFKSFINNVSKTDKLLLKYIDVELRYIIKENSDADLTCNFNVALTIFDFIID